MKVILDFNFSYIRYLNTSLSFLTNNLEIPISSSWFSILPIFSLCGHSKPLTWEDISVSEYFPFPRRATRHPTSFLELSIKSLEHNIVKHKILSGKICAYYFYDYGSIWYASKNCVRMYFKLLLLKIVTQEWEHSWHISSALMFDWDLASELYLWAWAATGHFTQPSDCKITKRKYTIVSSSFVFF